MDIDASSHANQPSHVFDATAENFEAEVLQKSLQTPVLIDFWAEWCGPCKQLGPILEKLAGEYHGAFLLAKIDVDKQQELAGAFQIRSIPTVVLLKDGQPVDGFPGALPEGQLREFLKKHGIEAATPALDVPGVDNVAAQPAAPVDPHTEVMRLRKAVEAEPDQAELKLDLALALLGTGGAHEARQLIDALPINLATDERTIKARARLDFAALVTDAPPAQTLEAAIQANPDDLHARYLLGAQRIVAGENAEGLEQFLEMLRRDRGFKDGLPKKALIDAFRIIDDQGLVSRYRRKMSSLLLV